MSHPTSNYLPPSATCPLCARRVYYDSVGKWLYPHQGADGARCPSAGYTRDEAIQRRDGRPYPMPMDVP